MRVHRVILMLLASVLSPVAVAAAGVGMPPILSPEMEAKTKGKTVAGEGAASVGVPPSVVPQKALTPTAEKRLRTPQKKFYSLEGARSSGGVKPSSEYLLRSPYSKDNKKKQEETSDIKKAKEDAPMQETLQKPVSPTPVANHDAVLSIFGDEEERALEDVYELHRSADAPPSATTPQHAIAALPETHEKKNYRARHTWPMDQRIGQVVKEDSVTLRLYAPSGTQVGATASGQVKEIRDMGKGGWAVVIVHKDDSETTYAHLNRVLVDRGDTVKRRQVVGTIGRTGDGLDPHLAFGLMREGKNVMPMQDIYIPSRIKKAMGK